jgi:hypothetical protein
MKFRRSAVIATLVGIVFFGTSINLFLAAEKSPFIYFATSDPFLKPGQAPTRNDITIFGGSFVKNAFGGAIQVFGADYTSNYILGAIYGRDVYDLGAGFLLGGVGGAAVRFGEDDDTSGEVWAGVRVRQQGLVVGDLVFSPAFTAGLSAVTVKPKSRNAGRRSGAGQMLLSSGFSVLNCRCAGAGHPISN